MASDKPLRSKIKAEDIKNGQQKTEQKLKSFYSIGDSQAPKLLQRLLELKLLDAKKIKNDEYSLTELRKILKNSKIYEELPLALKADLDYHPLRIIPREVVALIDAEFHRYLKIRFDIAGSYRREKPTSGDIDLILSTDKKGAKTWDYVFETINRKSQVLQFQTPFLRGPDKVSTILEIDISSLPDSVKFLKAKKVNVKVDAFLTSDEDYMFALLFGTGSGLFNVRMRAVAKNRGYLLNHHGLFKILAPNKLEKIPIKNEKELFEKLNITYKTPSQRMR